MRRTLATEYFVDTNPLLYAHDKRNPAKQERATEWLRYLWQRQNMTLSWQVLNEFYANAHRRLQVPEPLARALVRTYAALNPLSPDIDLIERAWHWVDSAQVPWWDALILASAERLNCRYLLSEDFQSGRTYGTILVINPFEQTPPVAHEARQS